MTYLPFRGLMIPGIYFSSDYCLWLLCWDENPTPIQPLIEVWLVAPSGERICYVNDPDGVPVFRTYHAFDRVMPAQIRLEQSPAGLELEVRLDQQPLLTASIRTRSSLLIGTLNFLLTMFPLGRSQGRTETGKHYHNIPHLLRAIASVEASHQGRSLGNMIPPRKRVMVGDGQTARRPVVNHCTHMLEA